MLNNIYSSFEFFFKDSYFFLLFMKNCDSLKELHHFVFSSNFFLFSFLISSLIFLIFYIISYLFFNKELKLFLFEVNISLNEKTFKFNFLNILHKMLKVFVFIEILFPHFVFLKQLIVLEKIGVIICFMGPFVSFFCSSEILNLFYFYFYFIIIKAFFMIFFYKKIKTFKNIIISKNDSLCSEIIFKLMGNMDRATKNAVLLIGSGFLVAGIFTGADIFEQKVTFNRKLAYRKQSIAMAKEACGANLSPEDIIKISNAADKSFDLVAKNTTIKKIFNYITKEDITKLQEDEIRKIVKDALKENSKKRP